MITSTTTKKSKFPSSRQCTSPKCNIANTVVTVATYRTQDNLQCDVVSLPCLESIEINLQLDCSLYACLQWRYEVVVVVMILMIYELLRIKYHHQSNLGLQKKRAFIQCLICGAPSSPVHSGGRRRWLTGCCTAGLSVHFLSLTLIATAFRSPSAERVSRLLLQGGRRPICEGRKAWQQVASFIITREGKFVSTFSSQPPPNLTLCWSRIY